MHADVTAFRDCFRIARECSIMFVLVVVISFGNYSIQFKEDLFTPTDLHLKFQHFRGLQVRNKIQDKKEQMWYIHAVLLKRVNTG